MSYIKAPYNFVPVSDKVVFPEWGKYVSHDIPFKDGESGTITFKLKAESPVFVRQGHKPDKEEKSFSNYKGDYFIPGSSLKGAFRQLLEIITFSKMNRINDLKYSVRDFQNNDIYPKAELPETIHAGWLKMEGNDLFLKDCGRPGRISMDRIDEKFESGLKKFYLKGGAFKGNDNKHKSAKFKYDLMKKLRFDAEMNYSFKKDPSGKANNVDPREIYKFDVSGSGAKGKLVYTGQASNRNEPKKGKASGKIFEFIFFESNAEFIKVPDSVKKNFYQAYYENDKNSWSDDWKWRREQLKEGKSIPVFFRHENNKNNCIRDIGLSYLYKITYDHSVGDLLSSQHKIDSDLFFRPDMADAIFGYTTKPEALRGRIQVSHAFLVRNNNENVASNEKTEILSSPKPTYYPNYIHQKNIFNAKKPNRKRYLTYNDNNAELSGWKVYPVHSGASTKSNQGEPNNKVSTSFTPLRAGSVFEVSIRVHNLKMIELGAIISALTFHGNQDKFFHRIGMAKPLGYGKMSVTNLTLSDSFRYRPEKYLGAFESYMVNKLKTPWHSTEQIVELYTMCSEQNNKGNSALLDYMKLGRGKGENAFVEAKQKEHLEALNRYSKLEGIKTANISSMINADDNSPVTIPTDINEAILSKVTLAKGEYFDKLNDEFASVEKKIIELPSVNDFNSSVNKIENLIKEKNELTLRLLKSEADRFYENQEYKTAKEKYVELLKLCPENEDISNKLSACESRFIRKNKRLTDLLKDVQSFSKGRTEIEKFRKSKQLSDDDIAAVLEFVEKFYNPTEKAWRSKRDRNWKETGKWIGKSKAEDFLKKLQKK